MMPVMLGSGANLYGHYMFQGGQNPDGHLTSLQESQATGYPTDVPTRSYDFQAPLSAFGQERASFRKLKVFHYFLNDFGSELARMSVNVPAMTPKSAGDLGVTRASVRSDGQRGFLFVNNYVRGTTMPARKDAQFEIMLPNSTLKIPDRPIEIPSGAYFIWPFNLQLGNSTLKYATAQLFTRIKTPEGDTFFFEQIPGIPAELVIKRASALVIHAKGAVVRRQGDEVSISSIPTGFDHGIQITRGKGPEIRVIILSSREAEDAWKTRIDGSQHLLESDRDFFTDGKSFVLQSDGDAHCSFTLFPSVNESLKLVGGNLSSRRQGDSSYFDASVPEASPVLEIKKIQEAAEVPPVELGPPLPWRPQGVAMAPDDSEFKLAAKWLISVSKNSPSSTINKLFLKIDYTGDVARLSADGYLVDDNFNNGLPWIIELQRFKRKLSDTPLELSILPLRRDAPIFLEKRFWPSFAGRNQVSDLMGASLVPQYRFQLQIGPN